MSSGYDVLDIPARVITTGNRTARNVQIKKSVRVVSVMFKSAHRRTLAEAVDAVNSVVA